MPIVRVRVRVCMCLYTPGPRNYFVFFLLSETLDPQYERETPPPHPRPFYLSKKECNSSGGGGGSGGGSFVENVLA